jgi:HNH endonuclease/AP2 domain
MKANPLPPLKYLHEIFEHDRENGILIWKKRLSIRVWPGKPAGRLSNRGYLRVGICGICYLVHRIIYYMLHEVDPGDLQIDHRDTNRLNNREYNLRLAEHEHNCFNQSKRDSNKSGYKGVCFHKNTGTWRGYVTLARKQYSCGYHATPELAAEAVRSFRETLHGKFTNHG